MSVLHFNATTDNYLSHETGDFVVFSGNNDTMSFSQCGQTSILETGDYQTTYVSKVGSCNDNLYTLGHHDTLVFAYLFAPTMMASADFTVWGFGATDQVALLPFQSAIAAPDGHGGSFLSIGSAGADPSTYGRIHFMHDANVAVSPGI